MAKITGKIKSTRMTDTIHCFDRFIKYFQDPKTHEPNVEEENYPAYIQGQIYIARMYSKLIPTSTAPAAAQIAENLSKGLARYEDVCKFSSTRKLQGMEMEIDMCKQMAELLPRKISELQYSLLFSNK